MTAAPLRTREKKQKKGLGIILLVIPVLAVMCAAGFFGFRVFYQSESWGVYDQPRIYYMGCAAASRPFYREGQLYLPFPFIKENIDPSAWWDLKSRFLVVTGPESVYHFFPGSSEGLHNLNSVALDYPVVQEDEIVYLPAWLVEKLYPVEITEHREKNFITINSAHKPVQLARITKSGSLKNEPRFFSPGQGQVLEGEDVTVWKEEKGWFLVEANDGKIGYIQKERVELTEIKKNPVPDEDVYQPWSPLGQPLLVTWEFVNKKAALPQKAENISGINVFAPIWFSLGEGGVIHSKASKKYVEWAHAKGRQVWGVFTNNCEIDLTHSFLSDSKLRLEAVKQLVDSAREYELDGIDVDFEYMYLEDKAAYVQFIRELVPLMHELGRTVTVDVIFHSNSENWSRCYDHRALAESADYLIVMAYDQHTVLAGPVASLPWVERGVVRMLEDVPHDKLLLGVPLYTRLWQEEPDGSGKTKTTRQTLTIEQAQKWVAAYKPEVQEDEDSGQHYVEVRQGETVFRMWLEDTYSLQKRVELAKKYRLAGISAWRRDIAKDEVWPLLGGLLDRR
ncbi:MAG: glycosyl hydrolase family 18 protein [Peptococcaceae bacterium]|nr:glycosyl hydrolase family 18 protein [Peptococcaceae bacterium]MDH7524257.1 glycosyl hydrolase family 18 protein [Peptococcaceae bacterium]